MQEGREESEGGRQQRHLNWGTVRCPSTCRHQAPLRGTRLTSAAPPSAAFGWAGITLSINSTPAFGRPSSTPKRPNVEKARGRAGTRKRQRRVGAVHGDSSAADVQPALGAHRTSTIAAAAILPASSISSRLHPLAASNAIGPRSLPTRRGRRSSSTVRSAAIPARSAIARAAITATGLPTSDSPPRRQVHSTAPNSRRAAPPLWPGLPVPAIATAAPGMPSRRLRTLPPSHVAASASRCKPSSAAVPTLLLGGLSAPSAPRLAKRRRSAGRSPATTLLSSSASSTWPRCGAHQRASDTTSAPRRHLHAAATTVPQQRIHAPPVGVHAVRAEAHGHRALTQDYELPVGDGRLARETDEKTDADDEAPLSRPDAIAAPIFLRSAARELAQVQPSHAVAEGRVGHHHARRVVRAANDEEEEQAAPEEGDVLLEVGVAATATRGAIRASPSQVPLIHVEGRDVECEAAPRTAGSCGQAAAPHRSEGSCNGR